MKLYLEVFCVLATSGGFYAFHTDRTWSRMIAIGITVGATYCAFNV